MKIDILLRIALLIALVSASCSSPESNGEPDMSAPPPDAAIMDADAIDAGSDAEAIDLGQDQDAAIDATDAPEYVTIEGDITNLRACDDICADEGLACYTRNVFFDQGGGVAEYGDQLLVIACEDVPPEQTNDISTGDPIDITHHECFCQ